jgi:hypothetical protein
MPEIRVRRRRDINTQELPSLKPLVELLLELAGVRVQTSNVIPWDQWYGRSPPDTWTRWWQNPRRRGRSNGSHWWVGPLIRSGQLRA